MKKQTKYISDCGTFLIEGDYLKVKTNTEGIDNLTALNKFLTEYLDEIKVKVEPKSETDPKEELFLSIIESGKWEGDYYLNKEGKKIIYNGGKDNVWIDYYLFWESFHAECNMDYEEVQEFMKDALLKYLKIEVKIPGLKYG